MSAPVVVDTSAMVAIELAEPDARWFANTLAVIEYPVMSAGSLQELIVVLGHRVGVASVSTLDFGAAVSDWIRDQGVRVVPVDDSLATLGAASTLRYRSSPARFNFGDGFSYALALDLGAAILCKGDDFAMADVHVLRPPRRL